MKSTAILAGFVLAVPGCSSPAARKAPPPSRVLDVRDVKPDRIAALDRARTVVLLEGGILEEHGPYLPAFSDGYQSGFLAARVADAIVARPDWMVLRFPSLPLGAMPANEIGGRFSFSGSYPVRMTTLRAVYMDLATDLGEAGFQWVVVVNYHGGPNHNRAIDDASRYFSETYGGQMLNVMGLASVAGAAPRDLFRPAQREHEGFSVHADADEHSRILFLRPDLVATTLAAAPEVIGHSPADLETLARRPDWPGYFGTPAIANPAAGRRAMDALGAAASEAVLKMLDGTLDRSAPRVTDLDASDPTFKAIIDASLTHERDVERKESDWLASASHRAPPGGNRRADPREAAASTDKPVDTMVRRP